MKLLGIENAKTTKGEDLGYLTGICYLAPSEESGYNTCADASAGCKADCLFTAGRGRMKSVKEARIAKTLLFFRNKNAWLTQLVKEVKAFVKKAEKEGFVPCIRLNGTSDLPWEKIKIDGKNIMEAYPSVQFYDYTKSFSRMQDFLDGKMPPNYHLTFSRSEDNDEQVQIVLARGGNVAVVFHKVPENYLGFEVVNGDEHDLRFLDRKNAVVGLKAKGLAKKNNSAFVVTA